MRGRVTEAKNPSKILLVRGTTKVSVIANSEDSESTKRDGSIEQGGVSTSVSDSNTADKGKKNKGSEVDNSKDNTDNGGKLSDDNNSANNNNNGQSGSQKTDNPVKDTSSSKKESKEKGGDNAKKTMTKGNGNKGDSGVASKDSYVEECDPSNKCIDDKNKLVACLRVSGNDLQYSLLIQNKGKKPLKVTISAPDLVQLEKKEIQLQAEGNQMVEVSITKGGSNDSIVLRAENGHCNLDIKHLIPEKFDEELVDSQKYTYMNFVSRTRTIVFLSFVSLLILATGWTCISFRKKQISSSGSKYQRLDMDLPVTSREKAESEQINEGWDNSWGDDWDDEEAPSTPSIPVTPSLSSKGHASRRLSKEGWKD